MNLGLANLDQFDDIEQLITLSLITLNSFHCTIETQLVTKSGGHDIFLSVV
jgi:hypothetical protein